MERSYPKERRAMFPHTPHPQRQRGRVGYSDEVRHAPGLEDTDRERRKRSPLRSSPHGRRERERSPELIPRSPRRVSPHSPDYHSSRGNIPQSRQYRERSISPPRLRRSNPRHRTLQRSGRYNDLSNERELFDLRREVQALRERMTRQEGSSQKQPEPQESTGSVTNRPRRVPSAQPADPRTQHLERELQEIRSQIQRMAQIQSRPQENKPDFMESPFTDEVMSVPLPTGFRMPQMDPYDGLSDPRDHLSLFKARMQLCPVPDAILCRAFPATLNKAARVWYSGLRPRSVGSFYQLSELFLRRFIGGEVVTKTSLSLMTVKQNEGEKLHRYLERFHKATAEIKELDEMIAMSALVKGVRHKELQYSIAKKQPKTYEEARTRARKYAEADLWKEREAGTSKRSFSPKRDMRTPAEVLLEVEHKEILPWPAKVKANVG